MLPDDPDYYEVTNGLSRPLIKGPVNPFLPLLLILAIIFGMALLIESVVAR